MKRKAQGLSITTIIVAAIALIVLVVLVAIFTGRIGGFSSGVNQVAGDITKDCADISPGYELRNNEDCSALTVVSKDSATSASQVCCTK